MRIKKISLFLFLIIFSTQAAFSFERIVTLTPSISEWTAEILGENEAKLKIVGTSEYSHYPNFLKNKNILGPYHKLNIEKIAALKPDLILASTENNRPEQLEQLVRLKLPVRILKAESFSGMSEWLNHLGILLEKADEGNKLSQRWEKEVAGLSGKSASKKSYFLEVQHTPLISVGGVGFLEEAFSKIGYENVLKGIKQTYPKVSKEAVLKKNPDYIFILSLIGQEKEIELAQSDWEQFKDLKAVRGRNIKVLEGDDFARCSFRLLKALKTIDVSAKVPTH